MRKLKILGIAVISSLALSGVGVVASEKWNVMVSNQEFIVDGKDVEANALNINEKNYVEVAQFSELLDIDISYNEATNTVIIDKSSPFSGVRYENSADNQVNAEKHIIASASENNDNISSDVDLTNDIAYYLYQPYELSQEEVDWWAIAITQVTNNRNMVEPYLPYMSDFAIEQIEDILDSSTGGYIDPSILSQGMADWLAPCVIQFTWNWDALEPYIPYISDKTLESIKSLYDLRKSSDYSKNPNILSPKKSVNWWAVMITQVTGDIRIAEPYFPYVSEQALKQMEYFLHSQP